MKKMKILFVVSLLFTLSYAENTTVKLSYENLNFDNSMTKYKGKVYGILLSHQADDALYQIAYEKTNTDTFQPPMPEDLDVNKYYLKYTHMLGDKQAFSVSYATIDDNLVQETDGGHIYGLGYKYAAFSLTQYMSDYINFNVYQTDMKYKFKKAFGEIHASATVLGKYIHLQDRENNPYSTNAKEDYFTPGVKLHAHYHDYHMAVGAYFGKRIFAVMYDGFKVQHHAMEFNETYMIGFGKHFGDVDLNLKYVYQEATEIPIHNDNVKVQNVGLVLRYRF
ncbi:hypothetical protein ACLHDG_10430 [Sulfurovum sp. CS9]|uniref:hypothetical protein n=1 Tax=Sulfurovum sp. CS9 TaxID=3391146 RepID=UPI0039E93BFA